MLDLILPDMHIPNHNRRAMDAVLQGARLLMPDRIILLGDMLDMTSWTRHKKSALAEVAGHHYWHDAIIPARAFLTELRRWCGSLHFIAGNHEAWAERFMVQELPADIAEVGCRTMTPSALLGHLFDDWIPYAVKGLPHFEIAPNLWGVHGWGVAKHAAAKHLDLARVVSVVHGHTHRVQSFTSRNPITNEYMTGWSPGCLSQLQPIWRHGEPTAWAMGVSTIHHSKHDPNDWQAHTSLIRQDGRVILDGGLHVTPKYKWPKSAEWRNAA